MVHGLKAVPSRRIPHLLQPLSLGTLLALGAGETSPVGWLPTQSWKVQAVYGAAKWTQRVVGLNVQHRPRLRDRLEHVHRLLSLPALVVSADEGTVSSSGVIPAGRLELEA